MNSIVLRYFSVARRLIVRMASTNLSYEDAISKLNSLQSNKSTIEQIKKGLKTGQKCTNLEDMEKYLLRVGIPLSKLDELSVIHVAGTKGKGSTSAMCESILRHHGYRTGFYSSPHLVSARERLRLSGRPLSREDFARHLHRVYSLLQHSQEFEGDMPKYFAFLTVVAFHVFLELEVDVAVVEVGIGGIVDYTNVLRNVPVVGITALGLDHTSILGATLPEIAAAKAGVMKRGCAAYTVRQAPEALAVLAERAHLVKCPLTIVPDYNTYTFPEANKSYLPVDLDAYRTNASLAIQLAHAWMRATQANHTQNTIKNHVNKSRNGINEDLLNFTQNNMKNDQNGLKDQSHRNEVNESFKKLTIETQNNVHKEQNSLPNVAQNKTIDSQSVLDHKITDDTYKNHKDQNGLTYSTVFSNASHNFNSQKQFRNNTEKYQNGLQNTISIGLNNGINGIQNSDNVVRNDTNGIKSGTNSLQNDTIWEQNKTNGLQIDSISIDRDCTIEIQNDTNKDQNGLSNGDITRELVYKVPYETVEGLRQCKWPGRYQVLELEYAKFYLDGAHTKESMEICAYWFTSNCSSSNKILIFSTTGDRNSDTLLKPLSYIPFKQVYFVRPTAYEKTATNHDNYSLVERHELSERCIKHAQIWQKYRNTTKISVLECVADAFNNIRAKGDSPAVLITGSLHLVGAALSILDPNLSS